jgi:8-oxo-dGTP pyrophosphatase MutT (NUDIX family)
MYRIFHGKHQLILTKLKKSVTKFNPDFILKEPGHKQVLKALQLSKSATKPLIIVLKGEPEIILSEFLLEFKLIKAGGGIVFNEKGEILVINRLGKWDLPKGKIKSKEAFVSGALREVEEETGIKYLRLIENEKNFESFHTYFRDKKWEIKRTIWFLMFAPSDQNFIPQLEEDISEVKWCNPQQLMKQNNDSLITYPAISHIVSKVSNYMTKNSLDIFSEPKYK